MSIMRQNVVRLCSVRKEAQVSLLGGSLEIRMQRNSWAEAKENNLRRLQNKSSLTVMSYCLFFFFFLLENIQIDCQCLSVLGSEREPPPCVAMKMAEEQRNYDGNLVLQ